MGSPSWVSGLGKLHRLVKEKNSPSKLTPFSSPAQSSRSTSIASSARRPRLAKSTPPAIASPGSAPTPTVSRRIRPLDSTSSVASRLARATGWW